MYVRTVLEFVCTQGRNIEDNLKARQAGGTGKVTLLSDAFHPHT